MADDALADMQAKAAELEAVWRKNGIWEKLDGFWNSSGGWVTVMRDDHLVVETFDEWKKRKPSGVLIATGKGGGWKPEAGADAEQAKIIGTASVIDPPRIIGADYSEKDGAGVIVEGYATPDGGLVITEVVTVEKSPLGLASTEGKDLAAIKAEIKAAGPGAIVELPKGIGPKDVA